ncbi:hypothetical protein J2Z42_000606 [Clostridium algifaecis]|uniref:Uncharacterized protein n=1 Tax=Clostridium algifaecis TaxID=1472040 RepID=A0ABS4KRB8_9CLOT|nr:hypothetical protein [Clostridium algifaecis]MBP2031941.1 hypothetical protein [Clostridium algifaecis]
MANLKSLNQESNKLNDKSKEESNLFTVFLVLAAFIPMAILIILFTFF